VDAGRTPGRPSQVGGVLAMTEPRDERPGEGREGCAQSSKSTKEGGPKQDHDFSTMPTVQKRDLRR